MRFLSFPLNNSDNCDIFYEYIKKLYYSIFLNIRKRFILNTSKESLLKNNKNYNMLIICLYFFNNNNAKILNIAIEMKFKNSNILS